MPCGTCGFTNDEAARFCGSCGSPLNATCPSCQAPLAAGLRFCTACGEPVAPVERTDSTAEPTPAERRRISVLFVDLENFTPLAETLDPEEVRGVQSRYFEVARSIVSTHGGTIEKFIGDAVMAVWGAPLAHEDDPERAVRAAIAIVDAVGRLGGAASGANLAARAAVATGEAAVTLGATGQGMVAGDLVNIAARLQGEAAPGGVLVDAATRELAPLAAEYETAGTMSLKGRSSTLAAHRASARASGTGREGGAHAGAFVGRERELRELVALFDGVAADRLSRLVSITGIAGIGKSRLAWEFGEHVEAMTEVVAWHAGRAPAYGEGITFAAVSEMVRRRIRVSDDASPTLARRQLAAALDEIVRDEAERRWMEPRVATLLGGETEPPFERDELFAAWRRFFERVAERSPVVLVFEDLQWAEPALLDFVEHLATWIREHPVLVIALARPELLDRRPAWGATAARFTAIHLEPLPEPAMRELLLGRAPELPAALTRTILERAGGVPLYAVEVARILGDRAPADGDPQPAIEAVEVPDSLHGVIAARIDALPAPERRLLLSAAVLGRRFRPEALAAVAGGDPADVREVTDALVRRELFTVDQDLISPGVGQLTFVQDLVREVAYNTLARGARRSLHLAAARYLESTSEDDVAEALAAHLAEAHRLAPDHPDAVRIARRAVAALRRAGRESLRLHLPERALAHLNEALRLVDTDEQRSILLEEAAGAARAAARLDVAEDHLRDLVRMRSDSGDRAGAVRARAQLASVLLMAQRNEPALVELESAAAALGTLGEDPAGVEVTAQLARARTLVGDDRAGLEWAERGLLGAEKLGLDAVGTDLLVTRGTARIRLGEVETGLADLQQAITDAETGGYLGTELRARNNLAWLVVADDPRTTLETAREGFSLAASMGIGDLAAQLAEVACTGALDTGEWEWALTTIDELVRGPIPEANRINLLVIGAVIGALTGREEPVRAFEAIQPLPDDTDIQIVSGVLHARAWLAFVAGDFEEALRLSAAAAAETFGAERSQQLTLEARAAMWVGDRATAGRVVDELAGLGLRGRAIEATMATLQAGLKATGGASDAAADYRAAAEAWRDLDLPVHLGLCLLDAQHLLDERAAARGALAHEARAVLDRLGAAGLLRLLGVDRRAAVPLPHG